MENKVNVLLLSAGRRVELIQSFQSALRRYFSTSRALAVDMDPQFSAACHLSDGWYKSPSATSEEYIDFLIDLCKEKDVGLVVPTIDTELAVLSRNRWRFDKLGINVVISDEELVTTSRDKRLTGELFGSLGIAYPEIYSKGALEYPCFCKPYDGSCSIGARVITCPDMLTEDVLRNNKNIFMEYIGEEYREYTIDAYYTSSGDLRCIVPRERIEVRCGEVSKSVTRRGFVYESLVEKLRHLSGARGCVTIQVFANPDDQSIKAIEINPRFGGGFPLSCAAGADYPEWLVREYMRGDEIEFFDAWDDNLVMLRYDTKVLVRIP